MNTLKSIVPFESPNKPTDNNRNEVEKNNEWLNEKKQNVFHVLNNLEYKYKVINVIVVLRVVKLFLKDILTKEEPV